MPEKKKEKVLTRSAAEPRREGPVARLRPGPGGEQRSGAHRAAGRRAARAEARHGVVEASAAAAAAAVAVAVLKAAMGVGSSRACLICLLAFASRSDSDARGGGGRAKEGVSLDGGPG
jgi:hypothetical protein